MSGGVFEFPSLPIEPVRAGQTLLLVGRGRIASRLARQLMFEDSHDDGMIYVSTGTGGTTLVEECQEQFPNLNLSRLGIIDATSRQQEETDTAARIESISSTGDLTGISIKNSILSTALQSAGHDRIRTCIDSLSLLLLYTNFRTIMRFVHMVDGRIAATKGLGVFVLDPSMHDPQVEYTLKNVCDGAIEVRHDEVGGELRVEGLSGQPRGWQKIDL